MSKNVNVGDSIYADGSAPIGVVDSIGDDGSVLIRVASDIKFFPRLRAFKMDGEDMLEEIPDQKMMMKVQGKKK